MMTIVILVVFILGQITAYLFTIPWLMDHGYWPGFGDNRRA